ncbi:MAG: ribonuclease P protein component [Porphyromonadaceae bacterium]|nr:ribonuclease P protein component [Porphyromonadaceae bacterium]
MDAKVPRCRLPKSERIHLKRSIEELFHSGTAFLIYPLRIVYLHSTIPLEARGQMMVSVSKKHFRRANKRNHIKRLVREAYRQNKHPWLRVLEAQSLYGRIAFANVAKEMPSYAQMERAVKKSIDKIVAQNSHIE